MDKGEPETSPAEGEAAARKQALAQVLDPSKYGPAFLVGAQAEFVSTLVGASSLVFGYDFVRFQLEASTAFAIGPGSLTGESENNLYSVGLRFAVPVHRGLRADFSLVAGGGIAFNDPRDGETDLLGVANLGARFRVFATPNVATVATLGTAILLRDDEYRLAIGARPLGAAGVVYFFR